jgi:hypothetical protein
MARLHRNNAAEWVMVAAVAPFVWIARGWKKIRSKREDVAPAKAARKSVMIEGLPPRTMN